MLLTTGLGPNHPVIYHARDLSIPERRQRHGRGYFEPTAPVIAGSYVMLTFTFEIGATPVGPGGRLGVAAPWPCDWADLQATDPQQDGYMQVSVQRHASEGDTVVITALFQPIWGVDRWNHCIILEVRRGYLVKGDVVRLVCGDRSGGSRGWRAPTCIAADAEFLMLADNTGEDLWTRLPDTPELSIIPGPPARLVVIAPSEATCCGYTAGETAAVYPQQTAAVYPQYVIVRAEDLWGNPTLAADNPPRLEIEDVGGTKLPVEVKAAEIDIKTDPAAYHFPVQFHTPGTFRLVATLPGAGLQAASNPVQVSQTPPALHLYWGDLHSGQTAIGCGAGTLERHYIFGRDVAGLQFMTHQANDHHVHRAAWEETRAVTERLNAPGQFVTFLGCEWSPPTEDGGDRNVIYRHNEPRLRRSGRFFTESDPDPEPDLPTAPEFHRVFRSEEVLINLHVGGRPTNLNFYEPEIEHLAEIQSTHGASLWFIEDALSRGYRVGFTSGTDGVMGRPGADHPGFRLCRNVRNGLTAVYAAGLTRDALWEAFQARRCYATSGERIRLWVEADGHPMGAEYETQVAPTFTLAVDGTAAIERIDLFRGSSLIQGLGIQPRAANWRGDQVGEGEIRLLWSGTEQMGTARMQRVTWDGTLSIEGATVLEVQPVNFQSPLDTFQVETPGRISWTSATAGNAAGLVLKLQGAGNARCAFASGPVSFNFTLDEVAQERLTVDAGGVRRQVTVGPAPSARAPRTADWECQDRDFPGLRPDRFYPYWFQVTQFDQARAWSSPIYIMHR